jgi:heme-degrading monooxygenase HmoA
MTAYHLAQVNIARLLAPIDDPLLAEFVANLGPINALADSAPGFVWRFQTDQGDATSVRPYDDERIIVNFSVWESVEALRAYVYKSAHAEIMRKRRQWFAKMGDSYMALWWVPAGHIPTWAEAQARLEAIQQGETPYAFSFRRLFPPEEDQSSFSDFGIVTPNQAELA